VFDRLLEALETSQRQRQHHMGFVGVRHQFLHPPGLLDGGLLVDVHHRVVFDLSARVAPVGALRAAGVIAGMTAMLADGRRFRRRRAADSFADDGDEWGR